MIGPHQPVTPVRVRDLLPGDVLSGTGETIVDVYDSVSCRKGMMFVKLKRPNGDVRRGEWRRRTTVNVYRAPTTRGRV